MSEYCDLCKQSWVHPDDHHEIVEAMSLRNGELHVALRNALPYLPIEMRHRVSEMLLNPPSVSGALK